MIKNLLNLGTELSKKDLQLIIGGAPGPDCVSRFGGNCSFTHNMCDFNYTSSNDYFDCMDVSGCSCYYTHNDGGGGDTPNTPVISVEL